MSTETTTLDAKLAAITWAIEEARAYEHEHGLATRHTRKLPADALRVLRRWHSALRSDTLQSEAAANGTSSEWAASAGEVKSSSAKEPSVSVAPTAGIRIPPDLREQAELFAREHRWSLSETVRVGLEQLVGYEAESDQPAERRSA